MTSSEASEGVEGTSSGWQLAHKKGMLNWIVSAPQKKMAFQPEGDGKEKEIHKKKVLQKNKERAQYCDLVNK